MKPTYEQLEATIESLRAEVEVLKRLTQNDIVQQLMVAQNKLSSLKEVLKKKDALLKEIVDLQDREMGGQHCNHRPIKCLCFSGAMARRAKEALLAEGGGGVIKQNSFFNYNLPLQVYKGENSSPTTVLNYMPRRESVSNIDLSEIIPEGMSEKDFFFGVSCNLLNLAILMAKYAEGKINAVYYHDEDMNFPPMTYEHIVKSILGDYLLNPHPTDGGER